jgi:asparagine synthase (glutamine-hydrolysing)
VPVGAYVSGGLDFVGDRGHRQAPHGHALQTFSVAFEDPDYDESDYQREVVQQLGTQHHTVDASKR